MSSERCESPASCSVTISRSSLSSWNAATSQSPLVGIEQVFVRDRVVVCHRQRPPAPSVRRRQAARRRNRRWSPRSRCRRHPARHPRSTSPSSTAFLIRGIRRVLGVGVGVRVCIVRVLVGLFLGDDVRRLLDFWGFEFRLFACRRAGKAERCDQGRDSRMGQASARKRRHRDSPPPVPGAERRRVHDGTPTTGRMPMPGIRMTVAAMLRVLAARRSARGEVRRSGFLPHRAALRDPGTCRESLGVAAAVPSAGGPPITPGRASARTSASTLPSAAASASAGAAMPSSTAASSC